MTAEDEDTGPTNRLIEQRVRNTAIDVLEYLAEGDEGLARVGASDWFNRFFSTLDDDTPLGPWHTWSVFTEEETLTITPLRTFPVIRDLVTDVSFNYAKAREIPSFTPDPAVKPGEFRMQQIDVNRSQEFRKCIECFLCQDTCHVIRDHQENEPSFAGPRFLMRIAELEMHPADTADRREIAQDDFGLGLCNITKCCTEVCPEHIKITDNALIPMKERVVGRKYDPLVWLGDKIGRRTHKDTPKIPGKK